MICIIVNMEEQCLKSKTVLKKIKQETLENRWQQKDLEECESLPYLPSGGLL